MKYLFFSLLLTQYIFGFESSVSDSTIHKTNELRIYSDVTVDTSETIDDNIRILGGDLQVYGTVNGQIAVIGGDVHIFSTAKINGKILAIGGDVMTHEDAIITGKVVEANMDQGLIYRETFTDSAVASKNESFSISTFSHRYHSGWVHPEPEIFVFNRNEGFRFTPINYNWDRGNTSLIRLSFSAGYRFQTEEFIGRSTLESSLLSNRLLTLYASGFKEARTDDDFRLPLDENTWANIFAKQDFYDRWDETGMALGFGLDFTRIKIKGRFAKITQSEIPVSLNVWSLFNEERELRPNPTIETTDVEYAEGIFAFRTEDYSPMVNGISFLGKAEMTFSENGEALEEPTLRLFNMLTANLEVSQGVIFRNRLISGMGSTTLPIFRQFGVGGLGSVSAFPYKQQMGTHIFQINSELVFSEEFTEDWLMVKLFFDAGMAYNSESLVDFGYITDNSDQLLQSAGIGFGWEDGHDFDFGFNFAKQLGSNDPIESTVRLNYNF